MGHEVRRVPPNWDHPRRADGRLQPMFDETFEEASARWKEGFAKWEAGERPCHCPEDCRHLQYWEWEGLPPERAYYRPWQDEEATWFQLWETVSEGTPVSPPFPTREELAAYLAEHGDFWDQKRYPGNSGWGIECARAFIEQGWAPSFIVSKSDGQIMESKDIPLSLTKGGELDKR